MDGMPTSIESWLNLDQMSKYFPRTRPLLR